MLTARYLVFTYEINSRPGIDTLAAAYADGCKLEAIEFATSQVGDRNRVEVFDTATGEIDTLWKGKEEIGVSHKVHPIWRV